jgi:hypothetical protein
MTFNILARAIHHFNQKIFPESDETQRGHMYQQQKRLQSTKMPKFQVEVTEDHCTENIKVFLSK